MKFFCLIRKNKRNKESQEIFRRFIEAFSVGAKDFDYARGVNSNSTDVTRFVEMAKQITAKQEQLAKFLEKEMDLLTADERYAVYWHIPGFFPRQVARILGARLRYESDPKCLECVHQLAAIDRDEGSKAKTAKRCKAFVSASDVLRHHDIGKSDADRVGRLRDLHQLSLNSGDNDLDELDLLVAFAMRRNPKEKGLFLQAIGAATDSELLRHKDSLGDILEGLSLFGDKERAHRLLKNRDEAN